MGRKKIQIRRIDDERVRKVTFAKRKSGLVKKAMELSLLCDCDIALLIFTPKPDQKFYKYTSCGIKSVMDKLATNPPVQEDRHNGQYEELYKKKGGKEGDDMDDFVTNSSGAVHGVGGGLGMLGKSTPMWPMPYNTQHAAPPGIHVTGGHKKKLSIQIPSGGELAKVGDLDTPNGITGGMFSQIGGNIPQLSPSGMALGSGSSGGAGALDFPSPNGLGNALASFTGVDGSWPGIGSGGPTPNSSNLASFIASPNNSGGAGSGPPSKGSPGKQLEQLGKQLEASKEAPKSAARKTKAPKGGATPRASAGESPATASGSRKSSRARPNKRKYGEEYIDGL